MLRVRTRGHTDLNVYFYTSNYPISCANRNWSTPLLNGPVADFRNGETWKTTDEVTPNFWKRKKAGEIILNFFQSEHYTYKSSGTSSLGSETTGNTCTGPNTHAFGLYTGAVFAAIYRNNVGPPVQNSPLPDRKVADLQDEVWTECMANRQKGSSNLFESLAGLDKTYAMLHSPLTNVKQYIKSFRASGRRRKGYQRVNAQSRDLIVFASSEWLRFRYGITPLMSDVKAVMKALKKEFDSKKVVVSRARASGNVTKATTTNGTINNSPFLVSYSCAASRQISCRATHFDKGTPSIFEELGLTFHNLIGVPWELTRYSFVVDWFANVGSLIYANLPRVGVTSHGGVITSREILTSLYFPTGVTNNNPAGFIISGGLGDNYLMVADFKTRTLRSDSYTPFVIRNDFRLDNYVRAADAAALVSQWLNTISFKP